MKGKIVADLSLAWRLLGRLAWARLAIVHLSLSRWPSRRPGSSLSISWSGSLSICRARCLSGWQSPDPSADWTSYISSRYRSSWLLSTSPPAASWTGCTSRYCSFYSYPGGSGGIAPLSRLIGASCSCSAASFCSSSPICSHWCYSPEMTSY